MKARDGNRNYTDFDMGNWLNGVPYLSYHGDMPIEEPWSFEKSITSPMLYLSQFIDPGDSIIDIGCGAGGCMRFLKEQIINIQVTGITNSVASLETCQSQDIGRIILGDFNKIPVNSIKDYDVAYLMESFFYFGKSYNDKVLILKKIKKFASRLVARIQTFPDGYHQPKGFWADSGYGLTLTDLKKAFFDAGWMDVEYHVTDYVNDKRFAAKFCEILGRNISRSSNDLIKTVPLEICYFNTALNAFVEQDRKLNVLATHVVARK